jgi:hypothetical protein
MPKNYINVSVSTGKPTRVSVSTPANQQNVDVTRDTSAYNAEIAKQWATSENLVLNEDYSAKHYAKEAKKLEQNAGSFESATREIYNSFVTDANSYINELTETKNAGIEEITTAKDEAVNSVTTARSEAIDNITSTKTTILSDIEFVADGEKQEIQDLADEIKDSGNTVNTAIEAGVERLNSIDALKKSQITNCILEIPQRIKLELNNGVLTLKAGSQVIIPNGAGVFDEVEVLNDLTLTQTHTGSLTVYVSRTASYISAFSGQNSSSDADIDTTGKVHYNTTTNKVTRINNAGNTEQLSFPIAIITMNASTVTSIDQVFNGLGYIGSTVWVDKGVKGLIPDGRNEDGALNNIEFTTDKVIIVTQTNSLEWTNKEVLLTSDKTIITTTKNYTVADDGYLYNPQGVRFSACVIAVYSSSNTVITSFQPKQPFRAVDYNDISGIKSYITETYVNGTSWYRVYSDGWCEQGGAVTLNGTISSTNVKVTLLKRMKSSNYYCNVTQDANAGGTPRVLNGWHSATSFTVGFVASGGTNGTCKWEVKGYIA